MLEKIPFSFSNEYLMTSLHAFFFGEHIGHVTDVQNQVRHLMEQDQPELVDFPVFEAFDDGRFLGSPEASATAAGPLFQTLELMPFLQRTSKSARALGTLSPSPARIRQGVERLPADGIVASSWVFHSLAELGFSVPGLGHGAYVGVSVLKNPSFSCYLVRLASPPFIPCQSGNQLIFSD